jgi:hypothetical protein
MSKRYQASTDRNVRAAYQRFFSYRMQHWMLHVAEALDNMGLRLRAARRARDWAVRKLR